MITVGILCIAAMIGVMLLDTEYENILGLQMLVMLGTVVVLSVGVFFTYVV